MRFGDSLNNTSPATHTRLVSCDRASLYSLRLVSCDRASLYSLRLVSCDRASLYSLRLLSCDRASLYSLRLVSCDRASLYSLRLCALKTPYLASAMPMFRSPMDMVALRVNLSSSDISFLVGEVTIGLRLAALAAIIAARSGAPVE